MFGLNGLYSSMHKESRKATVFVVYLSLLLDNVLLTMIVPIMPDFLIENSQRNELSKNEKNRKSHVDVSAAADNRSDSPWEDPFLKIPNFDPSTQNGKVSLLLSSKALVQLFLNPVVGIVTNRVGYPLPLFLGTCILLVSATVFAFAEGYAAFFLARSFQGVASSCIGITGMCLVAEKYPNEPDRSKMMGFVLGSVAVGVLIGYPFGGFTYDCLGKEVKHSVAAVVSALFYRNYLSALALQLLHFDLRPSKEKGFQNVGWLQLISDRRILLAGGAIGISTSTIAILEPCLPIWLIQEIKPKKWQLGTAFIPDSLGYFIGTNSVALINYQDNRSKIAKPAMILVGLSASLVPAATSMLQLVVPHFLLGFGIGAVDSALVPLLAALVDTKRSTHYGTVYAMQQMSVSLAYSLGPVFGSGLAKAVGFPWMMRIVGIINILYCPLLILVEGFFQEDYSEAKREVVDYHRRGQINYQEFNESENSD